MLGIPLPSPLSRIAGALGGLEGARTPDPDAPIGVFDSGVGGLTVLRRIHDALPRERFIYLADQAHVPYGARPLGEIRELARGITAHLFSRGVKAVVMACNISSATTLEEARSAFGEDRVFGMIGPGARAALEATRNRRIGVLATQGTVQSGAHRRALAAIDPAAQVIEVACPSFVPLVEARRADSPEALGEAARYLAPIREAGADTVLLGCTHYPLLLPALERAGPELLFVDPARAVADELARALARTSMLGPGSAGKRSAERAQAKRAASRRRAKAPSRSEAEASWPSGERRGQDCLVTTGDRDTFARQVSELSLGLDAPIEALAWSPPIDR